VVEWFNSTAGFDTAPAWDASAEHFARKGWIYVGISNSNQVLPFLTTGCAIVPPFTPPTCGTRYAGLTLPENGAAYEMVSQIVNLLVGNDPQNPLLGYKIRRVLHVGQSQQAGSVNTYAREFHQPSLSDGYFIQAGGGSGRALSTDSPNFGFGDPRGLPPTGLDVPVIRAQTETEVQFFGVPFNRQADTPTFRYYEIAGATHLTVHKDIEIIPAGVFGPSPILLEDLCLNELNTLVDGPVFGKYVYNALWDNLDKQAKDIVNEMPSGALITLTPAFTIGRDGNGNALGGIRVPDMNVPTGSYFSATNEAKPDCTFPPFPPSCNPIGSLGNLACLLGGSTTPFDQPTLDALYPTKKDYVDQVKDDARRLKQEKFLTKDDEQEIVDHARNAGIPN